MIYDWIRRTARPWQSSIINRRFPVLSLFKKFKDGFAKTVSAIAAKTHGLFGGRKIDVASLEELEEALYTADFGVETTNEILAEIKKAYGQDTELQGQQAAEIGASVLKRALA